MGIFAKWLSRRGTSDNDTSKSDTVEAPAEPVSSQPRVPSYEGGLWARQEPAAIDESLIKMLADVPASNISKETSSQTLLKVGDYETRATLTDALRKVAMYPGHIIEPADRPGHILIKDEAKIVEGVNECLAPRLSAEAERHITEAAIAAARTMRDEGTIVDTNVGRVAMGSFVSIPDDGQARAALETDLKNAASSPVLVVETSTSSSPFYAIKGFDIRDPVLAETISNIKRSGLQAVAAQEQEAAAAKERTQRPLTEDQATHLATAQDAFDQLKGLKNSKMSKPALNRKVGELVTTMRSNLQEGELSLEDLRSTPRSDKGVTQARLNQVLADVGTGAARAR